ncbi:metallophosphoesterase domain-containing protein 1 [Boletus edulis]|nr:metallophosphoesterase domain-containing protein 1 [Boletus edulis]
MSMHGYSPHSSSTRSTVSITDIHNTHNAQPPLPGGDILLHAGDLTQSEPETRAYICQAYPALTYLENDVAQVTVRHHTLRIYGSPYTPQYGTWAFQYPHSPLLPSPSIQRYAYYNRHGQPPQTNVLVTHGPPLGHLDHGARCAVFLSTLWCVHWDDVQPAFEAFVTLVWRAVTAKLSAWWWGRRARQLWGRETVLVNATSVGDDHGLGGEEGGDTEVGWQDAQSW